MAAGCPGARANPSFLPESLRDFEKAPTHIGGHLTGLRKLNAANRSQALVGDLVPNDTGRGASGGDQAGVSQPRDEAVIKERRACPWLDRQPREEVALKAGKLHLQTPPKQKGPEKSRGLCRLTIALLLTTALSGLVLVGVLRLLARLLVRVLALLAALVTLLVLLATLCWPPWFGLFWVMREVLRKPASSLTGTKQPPRTQRRS